MVTDYIPGTDKYTTIHLSLSDPTGDNAVLEYINGKLVIHHDPSYTVMTNDPVFEEQLAINEYWKEIRAKSFFPAPIGLPIDLFVHLIILRQSHKPTISGLPSQVYLA